MRWPRGKYNGMRIEGFHLKFSLHLLYWCWRPYCRWNFGQPCLIWLCFTVRAEPNYAT